jgi:MATE family multidrug resistance protein
VDEIPAVIALAVPVVAGLAGATVLSVIDSLMLGPLGEVPLAAASLTQSVLVIFYAGLYGLVGVVGILVGQAHGADNPLVSSNVVRHGLNVGLFGGLAGAFVMAETLLILPFIGQPSEVIAILPGYWIVMAAMLVPYTLMMVLKLFFDSIGRPWSGALFTLTPAVFVVPLNWVLIYGHLGFEPMGLLGAGFANFIAVAMGFLIMLAYLLLAPSMRPYRNWVATSDAGHDELTMEGYPMASQYLLEASSVAVAGILIGWLGATALAANQIVFSVAGLIYMAPLGLAGAVTIRIAQAHGEGASHRIRAIGLAGLGVVTTWMLGFTVLMVAFGETLARAFLEDARVVAAAAGMFVTVGVMQIFDGLQSVGLGALRGLLDNRWPTRVSLIAYWLIALPMSLIIGFAAGYGGAGVWAGFGSGLAVAAVLLVGRFLWLTRALR